MFSTNLKEKLETVLEEVGITSETVDEIVDILIQHEESLVADQKKHVTTLLGNWETLPQLCC